MKKILVAFLLLSVTILFGCSANQKEQDFNESGRAKAVEDVTDLWQIYDNPEVGISFKYPIGMDVNVEIEDIGMGEGPMRLTEEEEMETIEALHSGEFGMNADFVLDSSKKVKSVGFLFAQDYMVLSRFEVCNVTLERSLLFYFNNKEITITSNEDVSMLRETMPEYFTFDEENCGEEMIWNYEKQDAFYKTLESSNGSEEIQYWFNTFDEISETVIFAHR